MAYRSRGRGSYRSSYRGSRVRTTRQSGYRRPARRRASGTTRNVASTLRIEVVQPSAIQRPDLLPLMPKPGGKPAKL